MIKKATISEAEKILFLVAPKLSVSLSLIRRYLSPTEIITVGQWFDERFYIHVEDTREGWSHPEEMRFWLTVDIKKDRIIWNQEKYGGYYGHGGNCGVRTNKWKTFIKRVYPQNIKGFHWYTNCYLKGGASA